MAHPAGQPNFDIGGLIQKSWQIVQQMARVLIGGTVVIALVEIVDRVRDVWFAWCGRI